MFFSIIILAFILFFRRQINFSNVMIYTCSNKLNFHPKKKKMFCLIILSLPYFYFWHSCFYLLYHSRIRHLNLMLIPVLLLSIDPHIIILSWYSCLKNISVHQKNKKKRDISLLVFEFSFSEEYFLMLTTLFFPGVGHFSKLLTNYISCNVVSW